VKVLQINAKGQILQVEQGKGTLVYALTIFLLNIGTILALVKKVLKADKDFKKPLFIILLGALLMVGLIVAFNFVLPAAFNNTRYIPLGALFLLPFVLFTSYSVLKHKIFNVKVASVAILIFILSVANIVEVIASNNLLILVLRFSVFILVLSVGVLLIKSVLREIKQKEELQILAAELEKVNGELKELDKARADFITIASHQLRTPPATIKWYVAAILSGDFGALLPDVKAQLEKVQVTNNSQISLIDDMLNASRIERGKMEFLFEEVEVEPMAKMTYDQLMPLLQFLHATNHLASLSNN
jgi:signal transduction histidine kinase